ncbi:hypothetical protein ACFFRR_000413 [Megaselia abdita]
MSKEETSFDRENLLKRLRKYKNNDRELEKRMRERENYANLKELGKEQRSQEKEPDYENIDALEKQIVEAPNRRSPTLEDIQEEIEIINEAQPLLNKTPLSTISPEEVENLSVQKTPELGRLSPTKTSLEPSKTGSSFHLKDNSTSTPLPGSSKELCEHRSLRSHCQSCKDNQNKSNLLRKAQVLRKQSKLSNSPDNLSARLEDLSLSKSISLNKSEEEEVQKACKTAAERTKYQLNVWEKLTETNIGLAQYILDRNPVGKDQISNKTTETLASTIRASPKQTQTSAICSLNKSVLNLPQRSPNIRLVNDSSSSEEGVTNPRRKQVTFDCNAPRESLPKTPGARLLDLEKEIGHLEFINPTYRKNFEFGPNHLAFRTSLPITNNSWRQGTRLSSGSYASFRSDRNQKRSETSESSVNSSEELIEGNNFEGITMENIQSMLMTSIPTFSGQGPNVEGNLTNYLRAGEKFLKKYPNQASTIVFVLQLKTAGDAKHLVDNSNIESFADLKRVLSEKYYRDDEAAYDNLKQQDSESVTSYSYRFKDILRRYNQNNDEGNAKRFKKKFKKGLRSLELQKDVRAQEITNSTLDEFIQHCIDMDESQVLPEEVTSNTNQSAIQTQILLQMMELLKDKNNRERAPNSRNFTNRNNQRFNNYNQSYNQSSADNYKRNNYNNSNFSNSNSNRNNYNNTNNYSRNNNNTNQNFNNNFSRNNAQSRNNGYNNSNNYQRQTNEYNNNGRSYQNNNYQQNSGNQSGNPFNSNNNNRNNPFRNQGN